MSTCLLVLCAALALGQVQLPGWLPDGCDDLAVSDAALAAGIEAPPLSAYRLTPGGRPGLLLGYASSEPRQIRDGVRRLAGVLRDCVRGETLPC